MKKILSSILLILLSPAIILVVVFAPKAKLKSYRQDIYQPLNLGGTVYILTVEFIWLWGLLKAEQEVEQIVSFNSNLKMIHAKWDEYIETQKEFEL